MPARKRAQRDPTAEWAQLRRLFTDPAQAGYEWIRPVVLFGRSPAARAQQTGVSRRTIDRQVSRFAARGMAGREEPAPPPQHALPAVIRHALVALKAEHPAFRPYELTTICSIRFGRRPDSRTGTPVLATEPVPVATARRYPPYAQIGDPTA